jgi:L-threonylcarbamoyladenylate synthase
MVTPEQISAAAESLRQGGLVVFPTETVYGLGANALDPAAIDRIYAVKRRPRTSPLIVHVASPEMAQDLVSDWPPNAEILSRRFWPGPLTLVLPKGPRIADGLTAGLGTVGLRMPAHPIARALLDAAQIPIAAPSANRFTELSPTSAAHVLASLGDEVGFILDGGPTTIGIESTVLSLAQDIPLLLRPGMITKAQLEQWIGPIGVVENVEGAHPSPGMHERHYSPATPLYLVDDASGLPRKGRGAYLFLTKPAKAATPVPMPHSASEYATILYETLHQFDAAHFDWIAVERPPNTPDWDGVADRLARASSLDPSQAE